MPSATKSNTTDAKSAWMPNVDGVAELRAGLDAGDARKLKEAALGLSLAGYTLAQAEAWLRNESRTTPAERATVSKAWAYMCFADAEAWPHQRAR